MATDTMQLYKLPNEITVDGMVLPGDHIKPEYIHRMQEIHPREGDVVVASYPRSGSTWMLEAVSLILNNGNIRAVSSEPLWLRAPYLEHAHGKEFVAEDFITRAENMQPPGGRLLKTHLPFRYISKLVGSGLVRTVVVMRNPKDMLVSLFHFYQINKVLGWFDKSWDDFFELFKHKRLIYGDWLEHVTSYWDNCSQVKNVLFIKYEDAKDDIKATLKRIAAFLKKNFDEKTLAVMAEHVSFQNMKNNPMTNFKNVVDIGMFKDDTFMRQGLVGEWKRYFNEEQNSFVEDHYLQAAENMGLIFKVD